MRKSKVVQNILVDSKQFLAVLQAEAVMFNLAVSTPNGDWIMKGTVDIAKNIITFI